jgi:proteasome assembly chaperone (PAC2) family protein
MQTPRQLRIIDKPQLTDGRLVIGFTGWMDGGDVSTGSIDWLVRELDTDKVAEITPEGYYIYNFPGSMEVASVFRPEARIKNGLIRAYEPPANEFHCDRSRNILLFRGREPNMNWEEFATCMLEFAADCQVKRIYFVGSFAGTVPHTRAPRMMASVSDPRLRNELEPYGIRPSEYEGPASFSTLLNVRARERGMEMINLVAEIPAYVQGSNPKCIDSVLRKLVGMLGLRADLERLRAIGEAWEKRVNEALEDEEELAGHIEKLEEDYDNEVFDTQMGDLKEWLQSRGLHLD